MKVNINFHGVDIIQSNVGIELLTRIEEGCRRIPIDVGGSVDDGNEELCKPLD
jgi:hypothetical protein